MFVDPAEIGAICDLEKGTDGAIRSKSYFVNKASLGKNKSFYHSSNYAEIKDKEWEAFKALAIKGISVTSDAITEGIDDLNNI